MTALLQDTLVFENLDPVRLPILVDSNALIIEVESNTNEQAIAVADLLQYADFGEIADLKIDRFELIQGMNLIVFNIPVNSAIRIAPKFKSQTITLSIWEYSMPISRNGSVTEPVISSSVTKTTVQASTTSVQLLDENSNRKTASIVNNSTAILYVELGATASSTAYTVALNEGDLYELPVAYTGKISGIWSAANGNALVREFI